MNITISRRQMLRSLAMLAPSTILNHALACEASAKVSNFPASMNPNSSIGPYPDSTLPDGVRSRFVENINGLRMHVLEAGFEGANRPGLLLLHGFPELAFSWRKIMIPLAKKGYHVMAPDQRGYGRTTGWEPGYDIDISPYRRLNSVRDVLGLIYAMGHLTVDVVGHDFGSPVAAWCAVTRPDVFTSVALMSAPFGGTGKIPFDTVNKPSGKPSTKPVLYEELAKLPRPRKHYQQYYRTREANENMWHASQGLHAFLRAYYHHKSADWEGNKPFRLASCTAKEMAKMPTYYIMDMAEGMAETVAKYMPSDEAIAANTWLPDEELWVYTEEYQRNGFQGGLNWYRGSVLASPEQELFAGLKIEQPSVFISGASDWGNYQNPGALERMQNEACTNMVGVHFVDGAGHWVQQEQPEKTAELLIAFLQA
tara:strand:+ start:8316 stop:9590 length:1275 start_codon:yes stop_codon:yes gene_type:complete